VHVELWRLRARLAAADGDLAEAARLSAEADAAGAPGRPVGVTLGGQAELLGYEITPQPLRAGEPAELTTHWRLHRAPWGRLMAWVHLRAEDRRKAGGALTTTPANRLSARTGARLWPSGVVVPADAAAGRYRLVAGL
jgi:hypothetical protein